MERDISGRAAALYLITAFFLLSIILVLYNREISGFETRSALFVRDMLEGGNLLVPHLYGRPYTDYPPLFFLLQYICSLPAGRVTAVSISLPSAVSAASLILLTSWFTGRHLGKKTAFISAICLASIPEFWLKAEKATLDMFLSLECSAAICFFYQAEQSEKTETARLFRLSGYAAALAGLLTKGPVGLILPLFCWFLYLAAQKRFRDILKILPWWFMVSLIGFSLEAMIFLKAGGGSLLSDALSSQMLSRLGDRANKPFYYYFSYLVISFLPWLVWMTVQFFMGKRDKPAPRPENRPVPAERKFFLLLITWTAGILFPFIISASRHGRYILPVFMPISILTGTAIFRLAQTMHRQTWKRLVNAIILLAAAAGCLLLTAMIIDPLDSGRHIASFSLISVMAAGCMFAGRHLESALKAALFFAVFLICSTSFACLVIEPGLSQKESARSFVRCTERDLGAGEKVVLFRIKPDKNGIKYALFSTAYPDRLLFTDNQTELAAIPRPFILIYFQKDIDRLKPFSTKEIMEPVCGGTIHGKRVVSSRIR